MIAIAADTRISFGDQRSTDAGVKTYELGGRYAMVASGHALPPMMAAELTRSLINNHNRRSPERQISFFDTIRLTSFFLKRAADEQGASCRVAAVGFLEGGAPCIASIVVSPGFNRAAFHKIDKGAKSVMPVGNEIGSRLLLESMAEAKRQNRPTIAAAINVLFYTSRHAGAFPTIGGGISVGTCMFESDNFSWPIVEINGTKFLRGMDITAAYRLGWPTPEIIFYDEEWCAELDRRVASLSAQPIKPKGKLPGFDIDAIKPETLFTFHAEPDLSVQF